MCLKGANLQDISIRQAKKEVRLIIMVAGLNSSGFPRYLVWVVGILYYWRNFMEEMKWNIQETGKLSGREPPIARLLVAWVANIPSI